MNLEKLIVEAWENAGLSQKALASSRLVLGQGIFPNADLGEAIVFDNVAVPDIALFDDLHSCSVWDRRHRALTIAVAGGSTRERRNFRIAFELGVACIFFATEDRVNVDYVRCHRFLKEFAASFLMPAESVRRLALAKRPSPKFRKIESMASLASRFSVSEEAMAFRLRDRIRTRYQGKYKK